MDLRPIYLENNSELDLNKADLIARVDSRNLSFLTPYYLIDNANGTVLNEFGGLEKGYANPELTVRWVGEDNGEHAAVEFGYVPGERSRAVAMGPVASWVLSSSFAHTVAGFPPVGSPLYFLTRSNEKVMLAAAADVGIPGARYYDKGFFAMPILSRIDDNDLDFDANAYGFALGFGGRVYKDVAASLYGGYTSVDVDFTVTGPDEEDQDLYFGGFALSYAPRPYFVRLLGNVHTEEHDYQGLTGANYELSEEADYDSWGFDAELTAGYIFRRGNLSITPEVGLGYTYYEADDFHTEVAANPVWNRYYDTDSVDFLKGIFGLNLALLLKEKSMLYGSVHLQQAFGDNDLDMTCYLQGLPRYELEQDISDTTVVAQGGLSLKFGRFVLDLNGRGDFNADYKTYTGKAVLRINF